MTTLARHADWRWAAVAVLPVVSWLAAFHGTAVFAQQGATVQVTIDSPAAGLAVANGQSIEISGWAVDWSAGFGTGIDRVEVYIDGPRGLSPLGFEATYGTFRPDVTEVFGRPDWVGSGFRLQWTLLGLAPGQHTLYVYAHSTYGGWSSGAVTMAVVPTTLASWSDYVPPQPIVLVGPAPVFQPGQPPPTYLCNPSLPYGVFDSYGYQPCPR